MKIPRPESPIESHLYLALLRRDLGSGCLSQFQVGKYRLDFAYPAERLAIECDGHDYHKTKEQRGHDAQRDRFLQAEGWRVARFTGSEIYANPDACAGEIAALLEAALPAEKPHTAPAIRPITKPLPPAITTKYTKNVLSVISALERHKRHLVLTALMEASNVVIFRKPGLMLASFTHDGVWATRLRDAGPLFRAIGEEVFGAPLQVEVRISDTLSVLSVSDYMRIAKEGLAR